MTSGIKNRQSVSGELSKKGVAIRGPFKSVLSSESTGEGLAYTENMWLEGVMLRTVPGFRCLTPSPLGAPICGMELIRDTGTGKDAIAVRAGTKLFVYPDTSLSGAPTVIGGLADSAGSVLGAHSSLWVFDGKDPKRVRLENGKASVEGIETAYIPTRFVDSTPYERRNLLTDRFREIVTPAAETPHPYTDGLTYEVLMPGEVWVTGISTPDESVCIPPTVLINGEAHRVTSVGPSAFENNVNIKSLILGQDVGVSRSAFKGCTSLEFVAFSAPSGERHLFIEDEAFVDCPLEDIYISDTMLESHTNALIVAQNAFSPRLELLGTRVFYSADAELFANLCSDYIRICEEDYEGLTLEAAYEDAFIWATVAPSSRSVGIVSAENPKGTPLKVYGIYRKSEPDIIRYITVRAPSGTPLKDKHLLIEGIAEPMTVVTSYGSERSIEAIRGTTLSLGFDGRVFLSGNPHLPNTVFYSDHAKRDARVLLAGDTNLTEASGNRAEPFYIPEGNVFDDGVGSDPISLLHASPSTLYVFKSGSGEIYCHRPSSDGYTSDGGAVESGCIGGGSFFGSKPCYLSRDGLVRIDKASSGEYTLTRLTDTIPSIAFSLKKMHGLTRFGADTVILADDKFYIGRPSDGDVAGWFCLADVGVYKGQAHIFKPLPTGATVETKNGTLTLNSDTSGIYYCYMDGDMYPIVCVERTVADAEPALTPEGYSSDLYELDPDTGDYIALGTRDLYFTYADDNSAYLAKRTGAMCEGSRDLPVFVKCLNSKLYFGTKSGCVCVFNTDKEGREVFRINTDYKGGLFVWADGALKPLAVYPEGLECAFVDTDGDVFKPTLESGCGKIRQFTLSTTSTGSHIFPDAAGLAGNNDGAYVFEDTVRGCIYPVTPVPKENGTSLLHQFYYSFNARPIRTLAITQRDFLGMPYVAKSTLHGGVMLAIDTGACGDMSILCRTDREAERTVLSLHRSKEDTEKYGKPFSFNTPDGIGYVIVPEKMRSYLWKQYTITSRGIYSPIGIYMLTHRFKTLKPRAW